MPQATLKAYFTLLPQVKPEPQTALKIGPSKDEQKAEAKDGAAPNELTVDPNADKSSIIAMSVLDSIDQSVFGNGCLDFFVPPHLPQAAIIKVLPTHLSRLKNITTTLLPVRYSDKFFNECLEVETVSELTRVVLWNAQPVGWIRCRLEEDDGRESNQVYVQVLGLLAPYRGCGLATCLLGQISSPEILRKYRITSIYCHVWELNKDALEWYEKQGFERIVLLNQYYRKLRPQGAWLMRKDNRALFSMPPARTTQSEN